MLKTLLKKQFLSVFGQMGMNKKSPSGKNKKRRGVGSYIALIAVFCLLMGAVFFGAFTLISKPLASAGYGWLYFVYAGILGGVLSIVGSIFMTQSCLYEAKDNELLLSLPIPPRYVLFVRMVPLYVQNFLFSAVVFIPACIGWCVGVGATVSQIIIWILMVVITPFLALFITCLLGLLLALITSRMRDKTLVTVLLSVLFLVGYFIAYASFMNDMGVLVDNAEGIANGIKNALYPLYKFGEACMGDWVGFVIIFVLTGVLFGGLYAVLSKTYIRLVTVKHGGYKAKYKGKPEKPCSLGGALLKKEVRRFFSSGIYFLNCGLGVILLLVFTVYFTVDGKNLLEQLDGLEVIRDILPAIMVFAVAIISSMDCVTAPSISLEGKALWILHATPVESRSVLMAKLLMHYIVTAPAATVCMAVFAIFLAPSWSMIILMLLSPSIAVAFSGVLGLVFGLKKPNFEWDNETVVLKQSSSVLFSMLSGFGVFAVLIGLFFAAYFFIGMELSLLICLILLAALTAVLWVWLMKKGTRIFMELL